MTDSTEGGRPTAPEEIDTGQPVTELATLTTPVRPGFAERVRHRIDRRTLANNALAASWYFPIIVALEYVVMVFELLGFRNEDDKGGPR